MMPVLLPWRTRSVEAITVRGNIETRLRKLIEGDAHGLVVAKAALDRLLGFGPPFEREAAAIREHLHHCRWMVMPMREFPWAPAQGAIAIEIASARADLGSLIEPIVCTATTAAANAERHVSKRLAAAVIRHWARRLSSDPTGASYRSLAGAPGICSWGSFKRSGPHLSSCRSPDACGAAGRGESRQAPAARGSTPPSDGAGLWVARAEALPEQWSLMRDVIVWAAGTRPGSVWPRAGSGSTAARTGLATTNAAHRCARGPAGRVATPDARPRRAPDALATYHVETPFRRSARAHAFLLDERELFTPRPRAHARFAPPWHASGPGRTRARFATALGRHRPRSASGWTTTNGRHTYPEPPPRPPPGRGSGCGSTAHLRDLSPRRRSLSRSSSNPSSSSRTSTAASPSPASATTRVTASLPRSSDRRATSTRAFGTSCSSPSRREAASLASAHSPRASVARSRRGSASALHLWVDICLCSSTDARALRDLDERRRDRSGRDARRARACRGAAAEAGADGVSPSDMMDGRTARLRRRSMTAGTAACRS